MEKKKYNKPEVKNTKLDSSINLVLMSANDPIDPNCTPNTPSCPTPPPALPGDFINPFKWFK